MKNIELEQAVNLVLSEALEVPSVDLTAEADLLDDFGADSFTMLEVMARLETEFKVTIDSSKVAEMLSPKAICEMLDDLIIVNA